MDLVSMGVLTQKLVSDFSENLGFWGFPVLVFWQALQIVIAFLPGGLAELIGGILYGTAGGLCISLTGIFLGTMIVLYISKRFGKKLCCKIIHEDNFKKYEKLSESKGFEEALMFLFFLPGVPKDVLTYVIGMGVNSKRLGLLTFLVRIPSIVVSVYAGNLFGSGNLKSSIILYSAFLLVGGIGVLIHNRMLKDSERK